MIRHSLRARVVAAIALASILTSLLFGLITFVFAYNLEDRLFADELAREVTRQQQAWEAGQHLPPPLLPYVRIYRAGAALPADLAPQLAAEPQRQEFFGQAGRHYHVARFALPGPDGGPALAVAETSRFLLVRPVRDGLILVLLVVALAVALLGSGLGWWLAGRALRPLRRLARDVAATPGAVPRIQAADYPSNELGALARALADAFARIDEFVRREQDFTRDASHELRTPLAVIGGAAEVLALDPALPETARPALRRIETASADMAQTLDLLLTLARETTGPGGPRRHPPVPVLPLVEKAVAAAAVRFPASRVEVALALDAAVAAPVDAVVLQLVLNNLVGNVFQHAGRARLAISGDASAILLVDSGPGLALADDLFQPFRKQAGSEGAGLGLAIVRRLCDAAGIGLAWHSSSEGTGFRLEFKDLAAAAPTMPAH